MWRASRRCLDFLEKCRNMDHLKQAHAQAITCGLGSNSFALSRLLAFCSNPIHNGSIHGHKIFRQIEHPTICICNTMIKAFLLQNEEEKVLHVFKEMLRNGMCPDNYTLPYVLKACGIMKRLNLGKMVHGNCQKLGFLSDVYVGNSLISLYSGFEEMGSARLVFDEILVQNVASWTVLICGYAKIGDVYAARMVFDGAPVKDRGLWGAMVAAYVQNNCFKEGLGLFRLMQVEGILPDEGILVSALSGCANLGSFDVGIWIHMYLQKLNLPLGVKLGTALIDMYAKCGYLSLARNVFDEMPKRDVICWNTMISGFALNGDSKGCLKLFEEMEKVGIIPDDITFISLFTACSYSGMAVEGLRLLHIMCNVYKIEPKSEHYGCIIDFLSRAGLLEEARRIIEAMPRLSNEESGEALVWRALLSACCSRDEVHLAEAAAEKVAEIERHSGAYVLLSNMYSAAGRHDKARGIRKKMQRLGIEKSPGCSSVEISGGVHEFIAGEKSHLHIDEACLVLEMINRHSECS